MLDIYIYIYTVSIIHKKNITQKKFINSYYLISNANYHNNNDKVDQDRIIFKIIQLMKHIVIMLILNYNHSVKYSNTATKLIFTSHMHAIY